MLACVHVPFEPRVRNRGTIVGHFQVELCDLNTRSIDATNPTTASAVTIGANQSSIGPAYKCIPKDVSQNLSLVARQNVAAVQLQPVAIKPGPNGFPLLVATPPHSIRPMPTIFAM